MRYQSFFLELRRARALQFYRIQPMVTIVEVTVTVLSRKQA